MITIVIIRSLTKKTKKSLVFSVPRKIKRYSKDHGNKITNTVVYARPSQNPIIKYGLSFLPVLFSNSMPIILYPKPTTNLSQISQIVDGGILYNTVR